MTGGRPPKSRGVELATSTPAGRRCSKGPPDHHRLDLDLDGARFGGPFVCKGLLRSSSWWRRSYPESDEGGRGRKSVVSTKFPTVNSATLAQACVIVRYAPELAVPMPSKKAAERDRPQKCGGSRRRRTALRTSHSFNAIGPQ
jgi:hypothetical protein